MVQFRMKALNQLQKPDDLDLLMKVTKRRGWIAAGLLGAVIVGLIIWSFVGRLPAQVEAPGLLTMPDGVSSIQSSIAGQVTEVVIAPGKTVARGDAIATVADTDAPDTTTLVALFPGTITGVLIDGGTVIHVGSPVYLLERSDIPDNRLLAYAFAPSSTGDNLAPGMSVDLSVSSAPPTAFGVLRGTVTAVDRYPANKLELLDLLNDEQLAEQFSASGPPIIVTVDLVADPSTPSGYSWSTGSGPPFPIGTGLTVDAVITQAEERPIDLVFGR